MARSYDAAEELTRALCASFVSFAVACEVEQIASRRWASVTFTGARHRLGLRLEGERAGEAAELFVSGLDERQFALRGHILADIALIEVEHEAGDEIVRLRLEALTVEES